MWISCIWLYTASLARWFLVSAAHVCAFLSLSHVLIENFKTLASDHLLLAFWSCPPFQWYQSLGSFCTTYACVMRFSVFCCLCVCWSVAVVPSELILFFMQRTVWCLVASSRLTSLYEGVDSSCMLNTLGRLWYEEVSCPSL